MHPICFHLGGHPVYWYGVLTALGFLAAIAHWSAAGRRAGFPPGFGADLGFWIMASGIVGARIAYVAAHFPEYRARPLDVVRVDQGGLVFYGGLIGAALAVALFARFKKQPLWAVADLAVSPLPLGHAIGRLGCLMNGCCFGRLSGARPGLTFPPGSPASAEHYHDGLLTAADLPSRPVHPTQLYEAAVNLALYGLLLRVYPLRRKDGSVLALYLCLYPAARFLIEFLRGDARMGWLGLSTAQAISLGLLACGALLWAVLPARRVSPAPAREGPSR